MTAVGGRKRLLKSTVNYPKTVRFGVNNRLSGKGGTVQRDISSSKVTTWVQRIISLNLKVESAGETGGSAERLRSLFSTGKSLDVGTRRLMEPFVGANLEDVRIHGGYQAEETARQLGARAFTYKGQVFGPDRNLDTSTREGMGLMAHELTHVVQQTQPQGPPPGQTVNRESELVPVAPDYSSSNSVLQASARDGPNANARAAGGREVLTESSAGNRDQSSPEIDPAQVADRVYHLMQRDLILERERATKLGG